MSSPQKDPVLSTLGREAMIDKLVHMNRQADTAVLALGGIHMHTVFDNDVLVFLMHMIYTYNTFYLFYLF